MPTQKTSVRHCLCYYKSEVIELKKHHRTTKMENICRTCLRTPENLLPLFDDTGLPHKIETICSIRVLDTDHLPTKICAECVININLSYNFRRVIINSDLELKRRFESSCNKPSEDLTDKIVQEHWKIESVDLPKTESIEEENISLDIKETEMIKQSSSECNIDRSKLSECKTSNDIRGNSIRWRIQSQLISLNRKRLCRCRICDFSTTEYAKYVNHKRTHAASKSMCNVCGKYIRTDNLKKHIATHTDPPVSCKECGKVFKNNESLRSHLLIHRGLEITCEFCGQTFKYRGGYKRHVRKKHTGGCNRKVKCSLCEKMFYEKTDLKKHLRSHTGERPYPCEYCMKGFSSTHALKTHKRQHTNEKPYACEYCPMAFPQKVSLRTHLKSKHSEQIEDKL